MRFQQSEIEAICDSLIEYDTGIAEIVQFGSSVYAPDSAKDIDVLVFTEKKKDYSGYLDAVLELNLPYDVDVVVKEMDGHLSESLAVSVFGAHRVLHGDGHYLERQLSEVDPTYQEAFIAVESGRKYIRDAEEADNELLKDRHLRDAFNALFHAARLAAMTYLSTEQARWGYLRRSLPGSYRGKFRKYIDTLHVKYFYDGRYPEENVEAEFQKWTQEVEQFIRKLEAESLEAGKR
jgi:predicted nucleotidyltransferase